MKNKIKQFAKGDFKVEQPEIRFSDKQIIMSVSEGEVYEGSFFIESVKGGNIRGLVYPSSFRVHCLEEGFDSNPVEVKFTYDGKGLLPGQVDNGKFTVVCNGGEYDIQFTAIIEKPYIMTPYGKVQSVSDFRKLAIQDFAEAKRLFRTRQFYDVLKYEEDRIFHLYGNMRKWSLDEQALEEFLVGIKQKEKIFLSVSEEKILLRDVLEDQKMSLTIQKNTWGYARVQIHVIGDCLEISQREFTTDDFVGNRMRFEYLIRADKLHLGHNFAQIIVKTPYEELTVDVDIHQASGRNEMRGMAELIAGQGLKDYLALISGKMNVATWMDKSIQCIDKMIELDPQDELYPLVKAHIYIRGRNEEQAKWILENHSHGRFRGGKKAVNHAYYLFLNALIKRDTVYTNRVVEELYRVYMKHPYTWELLCMIVNLDKKYRDYHDKLRVLERQFFNGAKSIMLYSEAFLCFQEREVLLRKFDSFEIQVLNFAAKYKIMTEDLALHVADLACRQKKYDVKLLRILEQVYEIYQEPLVLKAICMQLILGNKIGKQYFKWYDAAVRKELKVAQLYEYFMLSLDRSNVDGPLPKILCLYYLHGIQLDYRKTAMLYENIITYESEESNLYEQYKEQMKTFAEEHLIKRHIDDSFRVIYNRFINPNRVTLDDLDALYDICHAYHITTNVAGMKYVIVIEKDGSIRQRVPYKANYGAVIYLYDKESRIVWEGEDGLRYTDSISYDSRRLFYEPRYLELCNEREHMPTSKNSEVTNVELSFDNLKLYGLARYDKQEVFLLCTKRIREQENIEEDFLLYTTFELLKEGFYDKAVLSYLAKFYCGATGDMKLVWKTAREYGVNTKELAERIITQMLFSEDMFKEEAVFEDYYTGRPYFRLKQAYLAYAARLYVVKNRAISENIIHIMVQELTQKEYLADICKIAVLKYYADKTREMAIESMLKGFFVEMCEHSMVFPFYMSYPQEWLREVQLYDKVLVEYTGCMDGRVKIHYRIQQEGEVSGEYRAETLLPAYDDVYVKEFVLYEGEQLEYYFEECIESKQLVGEKNICKKDNIVYEDGKYGRLNLISWLSKDKQYEVMSLYKQEEQNAIEIFKVY